MGNLYHCRMLYLHNARLENLDVILKLNRRKENLFEWLSCVTLVNCEVDDLSGFEQKEHYFTEFLVWEAVGNRSAKRWNVVNAATRKYYKFK